MNRSVIDQLRDADPVPRSLTPPSIDPLLARLDEHPRPSDGVERRSSGHRSGSWAVPALSALVAVAVVVVALVSLVPAAHAPSRPGVAHPPSLQSGGSLRHLPPGQYAFAVGGDGNAPGGPLLLRALQALRQRCMQQRGLRYIPSAVGMPGSGRGLPSVTGYPSTWYPTPLIAAYPEHALLALRERSGFGLAAEAAAQGRLSDPNERYLSTLSPAQQTHWRQAWLGPTGCYGRGAAELFGSRRAADLEQLLPVKIYNTLDGAIYARDGTIAPSHTAIRAVVTRWSQCMGTTTGRAWRNEGQLLSALTDHTAARLRSAASRRLEVRLAVADTRCSYRTGQARQFAATFHAAFGRLSPQTESQLRYLLARRTGWIRRAEQILAPGRPAPGAR